MRHYEVAYAYGIKIFSSRDKYAYSNLLSRMNEPVGLTLIYSCFSYYI